MIFLDSRYSDGLLYKAYDSRTGKYQLSVSRTWPSYLSSFFWHYWVETDRLDNLALRYLGKANLWWQIMDINPEIVDPFSIEPGTPIRIPNE